MFKDRKRAPEITLSPTKDVEGKWLCRTVKHES